MQKWEFCRAHYLTKLNGGVEAYIVRFTTEGREAEAIEEDEEMCVSEKLELTLARMGQEGWEIVGFVQFLEPVAFTYMLKRAIE
jgi:hypothetical protein